MGDEERERLEAEDRQSGSFVGNLKRVLLPTRGAPGSELTARLLGLLVAEQDVEVTRMHVRAGAKGESGEDDDESDKTLQEVDGRLDLPKSQVRRIERSDEEGDQFADMVLSEAEKGYDMLVLSSTGSLSKREGTLFGEGVDNLVQDAPCPVLIVRSARDTEKDGDKDGDKEGGEDSGDNAGDEQLHRILLPVTGAETDRHAAEVAFALAADRDMVVDVLHVVRGGDRRARLSDDEATQEATEVGEDLVGKIAELGHTLGATVHTEVIVADHDEETIVDKAESHADLVVIARSRAQVSQRASFGHRVDYVVRHARCPVVVVSNP